MAMLPNSSRLPCEKMENFPCHTASVQLALLTINQTYSHLTAPEQPLKQLLITCAKPSRLGELNSQ